MATMAAMPPARTHLLLPAANAADAADAANAATTTTTTTTSSTSTSGGGREPRGDAATTTAAIDAKRRLRLRRAACEVGCQRRRLRIRTDLMGCMCRRGVVRAAHRLQLLLEHAHRRTRLGLALL